MSVNDSSVNDSRADPWQNSYRERAKEMKTMINATVDC